MCCESEFLRIKKFFCCWNLRIGSLVIAYLGLIGNVLQTAGGSAHLAFVQSENIRVNNTTFNYYTGVYTSYMSVAITYHIISALFHLVLIYGVHQDKHEFILPWLIQKGLEWCLVIAIVIMALLSYCLSPGMQIEIFFLMLGLFIFCIWLVTYTFMCVYSYYHEIKNKSATTEENYPKNFPPVYIKGFPTDEKSEKQHEINVNNNMF